MDRSATQQPSEVGEQVVAIFVVSDKPGTIDFVRRTLEAAGFLVSVGGTGDDIPTIELDYEGARYLIVGLAGELSSVDPAATDGRVFDGPPAGLTKVLVFPGVSLPSETAGAVHLELDREGAWAHVLLKALQIVNP